MRLWREWTIGAKNSNNKNKEKEKEKTELTN